MGQPSTQKIAQWAIESLDSERWLLLSESCANGVKSNAPYTDAQISELIESELSHVARILRDKAALAEEHGEVVTYQIDDEESPYIRKVTEICPPLLKELQKMAPDKFEHLCAQILRALGWEVTTSTGGTQDDGVDFHAFDFPSPRLFDLPMPPSCKMLVIGQAKRYKHNNTISETEIRKFVGGALKKLNEFLMLRSP